MKPKFYVISLKYLLLTIGIIIITAFIIVVFFNLIAATKTISNNVQFSVRLI